VPLTAIHATAGVLDITLDPYGSNPGQPLAGNLDWKDLHRKKPRPPLSCRECGHGLHAKVSPTGLRFFAHDRGAPECGLTGESIAHRLLKMELASAIRAAGWHAELEVPGDGWRADVLAISPDGITRMAWEAQLAPATADELHERTARMTAEGVTACWVTDKDRPFIGHVPSIRIKAEETEQGSDKALSPRHPFLPAIDGLGAFRPDWCSTRPKCDIAAQHGLYGRDEGPCVGHGRWERPPVALSLAEFVTHVLRGTIRLHEVRTERPWALGRHRPGKCLWTTRQHWLAEQEQIEAGDVADRWAAKPNAEEARRQKQRHDHLAAIAALQARQAALIPPAIQLVKREARGYVGVRDSSPDWAMGVPLFVHDMPRGVVAPVASRVKGDVRERLQELTVFVASKRERERLASVCVPGQRIVLFDVDVDVPARDVPQVGITPKQAVHMMFGRRPRY
jgi:hypothetical protein